MNRVSPVETVLFDIGGVLASDYWETLLLTPRAGLADRLSQPRDVVEAAGSQVWEEFATREATEAEYWQRLADVLGHPVDLQVVAEVEHRLVRGNPTARGLVEELRGRGVRVGVVSNNTSFWWPKQLRLAGVDELVDGELLFLSCRFGCTKADAPRGLLDVAAEHVRPGTALLVDDREENVDLARDRGFAAVRYDFERDRWPAELTAIAV
jgi:FMN phosphatase YigB (HAD superfamily)